MDTSLIPLAYEGAQKCQRLSNIVPNIGAQMFNIS